MNKTRWILAAFLALPVAVTNLAAEAPPSWGNIPLTFEANTGQTSDSVRFLARGNGYTVFLTDDEMVVGFAGAGKAPARMTPVGRNKGARFEALDPQSGASHYFLGTNGASAVAAPRYGRVRYRGVWPGIDMMYYVDHRQLEYDFVLSAGANLSDVRLDFSGPLSIDSEGNLLLQTDGGQLSHGRPTAYQERNGRRQTVEVRFNKLGDRRVGFAVGKYDKKLPLIIDPKLDYGTFWGGTNNTDLGELAYGITVDGQGNTYVAGITAATDFPLANPVQGAVAGETDAFVVKLSPDGNTVLASTYIGGSLNDEGHDIKVDAEGNIYVTGYTNSPNFPTPNGFQKTLKGSRDAYLLKLSPDGATILYSTYLGGSGEDRGYGLAVSPEGDAYLTGSTGSNDFPLRNAAQSQRQGGLTDGFVTKISRDGSLEYSTFLGGAGVDLAYDITISPQGGAYITGYTTSINFPRVGLLTPFIGGPDDAFVVQLDTTGQFVIALLLGGIGSDEAVGIALDADLNIYVTGYTASVNFPIVNALQPSLGGAADVFVTKIHADGSQVDFSTFWGSTESEGGVGIAVDTQGFIVITGFTGSFSFPLINAFQDRLNQGTPDLVRDAFLLKLTGAGSAVVYSTYVGGRGNDGALALAVDAVGNAYLTGYTASVEFPVANALQPQLGDLQDAFILKFNALDIVGAIDTQLPALGLSRISLGGLQRTALFGYADFAAAEGVQRPTGLEIIRVSQLGITVSELGLPLTPLLQHGSLFVESLSNSLLESIAIVNPGDVEATVSFFFTYTVLGESGVDEARNANNGSVTIPAKGQIFVLLSDYPFFLIQGLQGNLTFDSTEPLAVTVVRASINSSSNLILSRIPIHNREVVDTRPAIIDHFVEGGGWHTQIVLVNNTDNDMAGSFRFLGPGNAPITAPLEMVTTNVIASVFTYLIPPHSVFRTATSGSADEFTTGFIEVVPDAGHVTPNSFSFLEHLEDTATTLEAQPARDRYRVYIETEKDSSVSEALSRRTALGITNSSDAPATLQLELTGPDGVPTGMSASLTMQPRTQISRFLNEIPGFESNPKPFRGLLKITVVNGTGVTVTGVQTMINEDGVFLMNATGSIQEDAAASTATVFPYIPTGAQYATSLILFGPLDGSGTAGTLRTWDSQGRPLFLLLESPIE